MEKTGIAVWDQAVVPQGKCAAWRFPHRSIWVERIESEWHVLSQPETGARAAAITSIVSRAQKPRSSEWRHYLHRESGPVQPSPVLPDRPLVVRPDRSLTLMPGQSTIFFLELPGLVQAFDHGVSSCRAVRGAAQRAHQDLVR